MSQSPIVERLLKIMLEKTGLPKRKVRERMAEIAGITTQAISMWYTPPHNTPKPEVIALLADYCDADLYWVILGKRAHTPTTRYVEVVVPEHTMSVRVDFSKGDQK